VQSKEMANQLEITLTGCTPTPLAHYLKALGIFRLVQEQADSQATAYWLNETFRLRSTLDQNGLADFFLQHYKPTPIVAPWNGGSGFYPTDNKAAIHNIGHSDHARFSGYRQVIALATDLLEKLELTSKPGEKEKKTELLESCRNEFPEEALAWLDAVYVLTGAGPKFPPLLGTGGNDGRLEFTNNFMQRLTDVFEAANGLPKSTAGRWLSAALGGLAEKGLLPNAAIGQFFPGAAGGANATAGFEADSLINPWDFIFMMEGSLLLAASCVKRLGKAGPGVLAYPFTVNQVGAGYASASRQDEAHSRAEIWLPLWERPFSLLELKALFSEGKAQVGRRQAADGLDFSRAVATLGIDRGISAFQRFGFQNRFGKNYFAIPQGRFRVHYQPEAELLAAIDGWLRSLRAKTYGNTAPAAITRALNNLDKAIFQLCQFGGRARTAATLVALGRCEKVLAKRSRWMVESNISPIPPLPGEWVRQADDGSPEFGLAAALASVTGKFRKKDKEVWLALRSHLEPVRAGTGKDGTSFAVWDDESANEVVWQEGNVVTSLNIMMRRRLILAEQTGHETWRDSARIRADLGHLNAFLEGNINPEKFSDFLWSLILIDWRTFDQTLGPPARGGEVWPGAAYGLLKLCYPGEKIREVEVPLAPVIHQQAMVGNAWAATALAARRLRAANLNPAVESVYQRPGRARAIAASLIFPVGWRELNFIAARVLREPKT
jgi:CRISPR-associated protein Csx17